MKIFGCAIVDSPGSALISLNVPPKMSENVPPHSQNAGEPSTPTMSTSDAPGQYCEAMSSLPLGSTLGAHMKYPRPPSVVLTSFTNESHAAIHWDGVVPSQSPLDHPDFRTPEETFVVYSGKVFRYRRGDSAGRAEAEAYGRSKGVPENELDWPV